MSQLSLAEAVQAPWQTGGDTVYSPRARAFLAAGELHYYRRSDHYRDWIEVFHHLGDSRGVHRTLEAFLAETRAAASTRPQSPAARGRTAQALLDETRPLVGHRIVGVYMIEEADVSFPYTVFLLDDGRQLVLQSDPEGNEGGFPNVVKPTPEERP
jgi:hypothetical protein